MTTSKAGTPDGPARLAEAFAAARGEGRAALVTYVMGGDPTPEGSLEAALGCARGGADVIELGFPYSDPTADGPTVQRAAERALRAGATLEGVLGVAAALGKRTDTPIVLMGYLSPVLALGIERFFERAAAAGVAGLILADLPPEEADDVRAAAARHGVATVFLLAPTSTDERREAVLAAATGFVYFVSVAGVTGARAEVPDVAAHLTALRARSRVPVVVGFGVATPQQAAALAPHADGVVVGSAIVERHARGEGVERFVASLRAALSAAGAPA